MPVCSFRIKMDLKALFNLYLKVNRFGYKLCFQHDTTHPFLV